MSASASEILAKALGDLSPQVQQHLVSRSFAPGQGLVAAGSRVDRLLMIVSGNVRVLGYADHDQSVLITVESTGTLVGGVELLEDQLARYQVEAHTMVRAWELHRSAFLRWGQNDPGLLRWLARDLAGKLLATTQVSAAKNSTVYDRLRWLLTTQPEENLRAMRQSDLASYLGTSDRHLRRAWLKIDEPD